MLWKSGQQKTGREVKVEHVSLQKGVHKHQAKGVENTGKSHHSAVD